MFWRCAGGRKDKTRKDFVAAAAGFNVGAVDQGRTSGSPSTIHYPRQQDDRVALVDYGDASAPQQVERQPASQVPPPYSEQFETDRPHADDRPPPPTQVARLVPKGSEPSTTASSNQQTSMPMLVSPEASEYYESERGNHGSTERPKWTNQSFSAHAPNLLVAENLVRLDSADRPEMQAWDDNPPVRAGGVDEVASVDVQSVRPGWLDEAGPEIGDTESIGFGARKSSWLAKRGPAVDESVSGVGDTESIGFGARKSSWLATPGATIDEPVSEMGETESIGFGARKSSWLANPRSVVDESVSGIGDTESIGFGARKSSWLAKAGSIIDESASVQPSWMYEEELSQRPTFVDGTIAPVLGEPLPGWVSPKNTRENPSDNHEVTRGGQSSSEGAARPRSELADSPKGSAERVTERIPPGVRITSSDAGDSEMSDEGGLLGLIMDTNEKEAVRRRNQRDEKLRSAELARRVFSSCPVERNQNETEDSSRQQTPRQGTAEVPAQVKILRSQTMPLSDRNDTTPPVSGKAKRSSTPSASSRSREGDAPPSPFTRRHVPISKDGGRTRERREKSLRDETISAETQADAGALQGGSKARRFAPGVQHSSLDDSPTNDSPCKKGRRVPSAARDPSRAHATAKVRGSVPVTVPLGDERESTGGMGSGKPPHTTKRFDSSGSEDSAFAVKSAIVSGDSSSKPTHPSPGVRQRATSESTSDPTPPIVVVTVSSPGGKARGGSKRKSNKSGKSKGKMDACLRDPSAAEARPRKSSESGSTSSADSKKNHGIGIAKHGDRLPTGGRPPEAIKVVRVRTSTDQSPGQAVAGGKTPSFNGSSTGKAEVKMLTTKDPASDLFPSREAMAPEPPTPMAPMAGRGNVSNLTTPILPAGRRGRVQQPLQFGTPRERNTTRNKSRTRMRPDLSPLKEEVGIPTSPINRARRPCDGPGFSLPREDKSNRPQPGSAKDLAVRQLAKELGNAAIHGAPTSSSSSITTGEVVAPMSRPESAAMHSATPSSHPLEVAEVVQGKTIPESSDKDEAAKIWLTRRARLHSATPAREDSLRRRGSQRLSRSSSWDDGSSCSFHGPQAMFSPGRFNPTSGALSWGGSVDDSWCEGSVRSAMTGGTRNSSSASLISARGPSERKLVSAPQLSKSEKQTVERLKIKRSDVHFGYLTVGGSKRVYKIELNGEMRAAKVINMLGMNKEEMSEVLDTFDAELLALSRLSTPHIVKVYGASVSPAEIIVVSEFVEGGVLRGVLNNPRKLKQLTQRIRLGIAKDMAAGMRSLYAHGMQHRHLSSNAVLLTGDFRAKILGVGLTMTTELIGFFIGEERDEEDAEEELPWASREVLAGAGFSEKSDVYSFGIVLWEIMQKDSSLPYAGLLPSQVVGAKYNGEGPSIPKDCPPAVSRLMTSCWSNLPADRPSFDKICDILEEI